MHGNPVKTPLRTAALVCLAILGGPGLYGQGTGAVGDSSRAVRSVQAVVDKWLSAYGSPAFGMTVVEGDRAVWSGAFGLADRDRGTAATDGTIYELGSISKLFTCVAVMQLREQGKVDLDKPFGTYVPEFGVRSRFPSGAEAITVRMLMTHHSGLVTDDDPWEMTHPERFFYRAVLQHVKTTELLFPPGQRWHYSSFGVNLLGLLVERVSGLEFSAYMKRHVLGPLDMPNASFDIQDLPAERIAAAYNYHPAWDAIPRDEIRPAGSLRAPLAEAAHLLSMVFGRGEYRGRRILGPESMVEMLRLQGAENPLDQGNTMALGFRASLDAMKDGAPPLLVLGHAGMARHRSSLELIPAWNIGYIAAVNDSQAKGVLLWGTAEALLREVFAMHGQAYGYVPPLPKAAPAVQDPARLAGAYASIYGYRTLEPGPAGTLVLGAPGARGPAHPGLIPLPDGDFALDMDGDPALVFHFELGPRGEVTGATLRSKGVLVNRMLKLPQAELPSLWAGRAGVYVPADAESGARTGISEIAVLREGGRLCVKAAMTPANREELGRDYANVLFPLQLLDDARAAVLNGAFSGFEGYRLDFQDGEGGGRLRLQDASEQALYRRKP